MSRANISRGQLKRLPNDYEDGLRSLKRAKAELERVCKDIDDPTKMTRPDYDEWLGKVKISRQMYQIEVRELKRWLVENEPSLARQAYDLLCDLEVKYDFTPEQTALMEKLEEHFAPAIEPVMQMKDKLL